jgi:GNAT superfamily N-acetyltransferase
MDSGFVGTTALCLPSVGGSDAHSPDRTTFLQIRETVTASCFDRFDAVLYAYVNNERVAALDFTKTYHDICINMVFVKPEFRRRGIGSALVQHLVALHPDTKVPVPLETVRFQATFPLRLHDTGPEPAGS